MPRELDSALDRFRPRIAEEDALARRPWCDLRQLLAQRRHALEIEVGAADVQKARGRFLHGRHHLRMPVSRARDGDAAHVVEEPVSINVLDHYAATAGNGQRVFLDVGVRGPGTVAVHDGARFGPRRRDHDVRVFSGLACGVGHAGKVVARDAGCNRSPAAGRGREHGGACYHSVGRQMRLNARCCSVVRGSGGIW